MNHTQQAQAVRAAVVALAAMFGAALVACAGKAGHVSFKSPEEIRTGSLLSLPRDFSLDAWSYAWNRARIGARLQDRGRAARRRAVVLPHLFR